jgi:hypothetical protein
MSLDNLSAIVALLTALLTGTAADAGWFWDSLRALRLPESP